MKYWKPLTVLAALCVSIALADDFKTIKGKEYKNATVTRVEPDGLVLRTKSGISKVYFSELPKEVVDKWLAPVIAAQKVAEAKRIEAQNAADRECAEKERERVAAEREGAEEDKNAAADLKRVEEQFQGAEERAKQNYQSAMKGTLSGQVFVSTSGGESHKLGAIKVVLFARDAIDGLLPQLKNYADLKVQELSPSVDAAKAASDQADAADYISEAANKARDEYKESRDKRDFYYSGAFFFSYLQHPIEAVETDADGKFAIEVPKQGSFVIAAKAERVVTVIDWKAITEHDYWLQPVSLGGQQQRVQNLSNNNLTSTTGTSSLIVTKD